MAGNTPRIVEQFSSQRKDSQTLAQAQVDDSFKMDFEHPPPKFNLEDQNVDVFGSDSESNEDFQQVEEISCAIDLFKEICEAAAEAWIEKHAEEILEKILSQHVMQPIKKRKIESKK